jgi:hypothetical protein
MLPEAQANSLLDFAGNFFVPCLADWISNMPTIRAVGIFG